MMINHGKLGSAFRGRVLQLVTGSAGLDDWEWGVTLFAVTFDDIKSCVYAMRYDEASARYGEFGPFVTGIGQVPRRDPRLARTGLGATEVLPVTPPGPSGSAASKRVLGELGRVVVAFSGGADSALLGYVANRTLGAKRVLCVTSSSASLARDELADCRALATEWGLRHLVVETNELADESYARNDLDRCYHCKRELMDVLAGPAQDRGRHDRARGQPRRPRRLPAGSTGGERARRGLPARRGGTREARRAGALPSISACAPGTSPPRPASPHGCPHGTPVTLGVLAGSRRAEKALRALGFRVVRVRHYGETRPDRARSRRARTGARRRASRSSRPCGRPATATSRSTSRGSVRAT